MDNAQWHTFRYVVMTSERASELCQQPQRRQAAPVPSQPATRPRHYRLLYRGTSKAKVLNLAHIKISKTDWRQ